MFGVEEVLPALSSAVDKTQFYTLYFYFFFLFFLIFFFCTGQPRKEQGAYKQIHEYNAYSKQAAASPEYQPEQRVARRFDSAARHVFSIWLPLFTLWSRRTRFLTVRRRCTQRILYTYICIHTHSCMCVCVVSPAVSILHQFTAELSFTLLMFPGLMRVKSPLTFFPQNSSFWKLFLFFFFCVFTSVSNSAAQTLLFTWSPTLIWASMLDGLGGILKTRAAGSCCSFILITCTFSNAKLIYLMKKNSI